MPPWSQDDDATFARALQEVLPGPALAAPARSADDLVEQARAVEALRGDAAAPGEGASSGDLDLLHDLAAAETDVAAGRGAPLAPAVRLAALAARTSDLVSAPPPAPRAPRTPANVAKGGSPHRPASRRPLAWTAVIAALALVGLGVRAARERADEQDARLAASERQEAVEQLARAAVLPTALFVDARLWRSLEGEASRGGVGLGLASRAAPGDAGPDVVLGWRPDALGLEAATLRVHVRGPVGLRVTLPDLGVEGVLADAAGGHPQEAGDVRTVDLPLPEGWGARLEGGELRLAFTWPRAATPAAPGDAPPAAEPVRFHGVALARAGIAPRAPEGS